MFLRVVIINGIFAIVVTMITTVITVTTVIASIVMITDLLLFYSLCHDLILSVFLSDPPLRPLP